MDRRKSLPKKGGTFPRLNQNLIPKINTIADTRRFPTQDFEHRAKELVEVDREIERET